MFFSALACFRSTNESGVESSFIMGKSRVAQQKFLTISKLELVAAVSAVRLKNWIVEENDYVIGSIYFWTDSMTVFLWIRSYAQQHQVFVANRIAEIMDSSTVNQWNHVPGDRNPAGIGTRGVTITQLQESHWLTGPAWLLETKEWPIQPETLSRTEETFDTISDETIDLTRFSSYVRLRNVVTRVLSWQFGKSKETQDRAEIKIWLSVQQEMFSKELKTLGQGKELPPESKLLGLSLFIDGSGLIRAQGRIRKSKMEFDIKHPILLLSSHQVVWLYIKYMHEPIIIKVLKMFKA